MGGGGVGCLYDEVVDTSGFDGFEALHDLRWRAGESAGDVLLGDEALLAWFHEDHVPAVDVEIEAVGRGTPLFGVCPYVGIIFGGRSGGARLA